MVVGQPVAYINDEPSDDASMKKRLRYGQMVVTLPHRRQ